MSPKTGRPKIEKPMKNDIKVRLNDELHCKLLEFCKEKELTKAEVIRMALIQFLSSR